MGKDEHRRHPFHLDELVIVPLALMRIRRMIPPDVWAEHVPPRTDSNQLG